MKIDFANILKTNRSEAGLSQGELADRLGINRSNIGSYEEGRAEPNIETIIKMAAFFGYETVDDFLNLRLPELSGSNKMMIAYNKVSQEKKKIVDFILEIKWPQQ